VLQRLNREREITVVLVTHDERIAQHTERAVHLHDGHIINEEVVTERLIAAVG